MKAAIVAFVAWCSPIFGVSPHDSFPPHLFVICWFGAISFFLLKSCSCSYIPIMINPNHVHINQKHEWFIYPLPVGFPAGCVPFFVAPENKTSPMISILVHGCC